MLQIKTAPPYSSDMRGLHGSHFVPKVHRPIQYLGSKLRSLDNILVSTDHLFATGDHVVDLFSGSSVVSQAFANAGARVTSVDVQIFCRDLASAMLGICRVTGESSSAVASNIVRDFDKLELPSELEKLLAKEASILTRGPTRELLEFYRSLPQIWKSTPSYDWMLTFPRGHRSKDFKQELIIASNYAGTYFGLRQAVFFDYVRQQIEILDEVGAIGYWAKCALLTSLYSTMSRTVCSAGKHFAQPLAIKESGNQLFQISRLHSDRSIDPFLAFISSAETIDRTATFEDREHSAKACSADSIYDSIIKSRPKLIYADPPYTAQQYSRFYHVLEVASTYSLPKLQIIAGRVTSGIYNIDQYKSPFCSKVAAKPAFKQLVSVSKDSGASLAISYSSSSKNSTGNSRMIGLDELTEICKFNYGRVKVDVVELAHAYKPLNCKNRNNVGRSDPEVLIICEA